MSIKYHDSTVAGLTEFDATPTQNSTKAVTSGGIYTALGNKLDTRTITDTPSSGSTALFTAGGAYTQLNLKANTTDLNKEILYFYQKAVSATTGNIVTISDSRITANSVVLECTFANPAYITTDVTWTTSAGSLVLNGTCTTATTANIAVGLAGAVV